MLCDRDDDGSGTRAFSRQTRGHSPEIMAARKQPDPQPPLCPCDFVMMMLLAPLWQRQRIGEIIISTYCSCLQDSEREGGVANLVFIIDDNKVHQPCHFKYHS